MGNAGRGIVLLLGSGAWRLGAILLIKRLKPDSKGHPHLGGAADPLGLALLHVSEIATGALAYGLALTFPGAGSTSQRYGDSASGLLYFPRHNLLHARFHAADHRRADPPARRAASVGRFMLITWSATFVFAICDERFPRSGEDEED